MRPLSLQDRQTGKPGQHFVAFVQQFRLAESDCGKLFGSAIPVTEHPLETVHIDVCDVAHHQDGLLHLAGVLDQIVHRFEGCLLYTSRCV